MLSSLDIKSELTQGLGQKVDFIQLPFTHSSNAEISQGKESEPHKERMSILYNFIFRGKPDLFYIDESVEVATLVNLMGIPYVYARIKKGLNNVFNDGIQKDIQKDFEEDLQQQMAYGYSLFNLANYDNSAEDQWYKNTPYYEKTKYRLRAKGDGLSPEVENKIFCLYLEEEISLRKQPLPSQDFKLMAGFIG